MNKLKSQYKYLPLITALYVTLAQISYVLAYKMVPINHFLLPTGVIVFPFVYSLSNVVVEIYGYQRGRRLLWESAKLTSQFYIDVLGFELIGEIPLNTGTVKQDEYDMLNYLLKLPGNENQICVVTQGLNEKTVFHRYIKKYGAGIHHVAYRTSNIEKKFLEFKKKNISLTSDEIIHDSLFGLKQFFIDRKYSGVFIEIIERKKINNQVKFTR